jgi:hypothetical protein
MRWVAMVGVGIETGLGGAGGITRARVVRESDGMAVVECGD